MFDLLRRMIVPVMIFLLIAFVGWLVLDVGLDLSGRRSGQNALTYAGVVNGEQIPREMFNRVYQNLYQQETQKNDQDIPDSKVKELEQTAWQQLVHERLLFQEAAKRNIVVTDREIFAFLSMSPPQYLQDYAAFQTNGKFDYQKYQQAMADPQAAPFWASIEPSVRADLERMKMQEIIVQSVNVSDAEVKQAFINHNEKAKFGVVDIPFNQFTSQVVTPSEDEMRTYYTEHQQEYQADDRAVVNIAMVDKQPSEDDWQRVQARIQIIHDSIQAGADFATMAQMYSDDPSGKNGGEVGWIKPGSMIPEFDRPAFAMKEGELSQPFRTQYGWHIMKHLGYRSEPVLGPDGKPSKATQTEAHVAHILMRVTASQESIDAAYRKLQELVSTAKQKDFSTACQEVGITARKSAPFVRYGSIQFLGQDMVANAFAFDNAIGAISEVLESASAVYVVQVAEKLAAGIASFDEVRGQIALDMRNKKLTAICHEKGLAVYNSARSSRDLQAAAKTYNFQYMASNYVARDEYVPMIGKDPVALGAAFRLTTVGQISEPIDYASGCAVIELLERIPADLTQFNEKRDSITTAIRQTKQQELYGRWAEHLIKSAKIESYIGRVGTEQ